MAVKGGFRPGEDIDELPAQQNQPVGPAFTPAAMVANTDRDVLMGYQIILGRDPESSFVIADAKANAAGPFLAGLLDSEEFQTQVLDNLAAGHALPHESAAGAPDADQLGWLFGLIRLPAPVEDALRAAPSWAAWFRVLLAMPGLSTRPAQPNTARSVTPVDASEGFALITIEHPRPGAWLSAGALLEGSGWAIAPADIAELSVELDGHFLCHARSGLPRPDVSESFPHYRHVDHCGFSFEAIVPPSIAVDGAKDLTVSLRTIAGQTAKRGVRLAAVTGHTLTAPSAPAPEAAWPIRLMLEEAQVDTAGQLHARGWAISLETMGPIAVSLGEDMLGEAEHGQKRPDIAAAHPDYPNAPLAGFSLTVHRPGGFPAGRSFVRAQARDANGHVRQTILPVTIPQFDPTAVSQHIELLPVETAPPGQATAAGLRLEIDRPALEGDRVREPVSGALTLSGWATAPGGIDTVRVFLGETPLGDAYLGMRREDIGAAFPGNRDSLLSGFALVLPPGRLPEGHHIVRVVAQASAEADIATPGLVLERQFRLTVEPFTELPLDCVPRLKIPPAEAAFALGLLDRHAYHPHFEIALSATPSDAELLLQTWVSLRDQVYPHWTVMLSVPSTAAAHALRDKLPVDRRLTIETGAPVKAARAENRASNNVFFLHLRAGDTLGADALMELACASAADRQADFIYADELRVDPFQGRRQPFLKPGWSPQLLLGMNYLGRMWCAAASVLERAELTRQGFVGASDYELVLRLADAARHVTHVSRVLGERGPQHDTEALEASAIRGAMERRRAPATSASSRVSIIMPTCGARGLVRTAIETIRATTIGVTLEIVVVDNTPKREAKLRTWLRRKADIVIDMPGAFNWSRFNNAGAASATGDILLFLNDDMEMRESGWLEAMLEHARRPEIGVVGARLLYPDGKVQHAGQYLADGHARHAFRFADGGDPGPFGLTSVAREMISVTGACQMIRADVFSRLGGFDEAHSIVNNDLDLCLRSWRAGLSVIYTPLATLIHHELASRAALADTYDQSRFAGDWAGRFAAGDPFRSPRLGAESDHYAAEPEPIETLHVGRIGPRREQVQRILAIKLDHIGDFLTALPALRRLKGEFPNASIDLLAPAATAELARREAVISDIIVFDFFHARSGDGQKGISEPELAALADRLAPARYDIAIDLRMQPETRVVMPYTGAGFLAGYDHASRFAFLDLALEWEGDSQRVFKRAHISERLVQLVSSTADACSDDAPSPVAERLASSDVPALASLPAAFRARPLICIHPGVGNTVRQWPAAHYAALIDLLADDGLHAVLIGAPEEAPVADAVLARVRHRHAVRSLVGKARLAELPDIMRACVLFVGNNSGPKHLAASLGMPAIGIHSGVVDAAEWAPRGPAAVAIRRRMVCGPCYLEFASDCPRDLACLKGLRPADVFALCRKMLSPAPPSKTAKPRKK